MISLAQWRARGRSMLFDGHVVRLYEGGNGRRILPRLLQYLDERRRHADRWVGALTASPAPLLFIGGLLDPVSGGNMTAIWRSLLPEAGLVELADVGHYPQVEDPAAVLQPLLEFFAGAAASLQQGGTQ